MKKRAKYSRYSMNKKRAAAGTDGQREKDTKKYSRVRTIEQARNEYMRCTYGMPFYLWLSQRDYILIEEVCRI